MRPADWRIEDARGLLRAQWELLVAQLIVWTRPRGRLVSVRTDLDHGVAQAPPPEAFRIAWNIGRAARRGVFRPLCLVRSVAMQRLLVRHGLPDGRIRFGVRYDDGKFAAHAWLEYGGMVLGEPEDFVRTFAELPDLGMRGVA